MRTIRWHPITLAGAACASLAWLGAGNEAVPTAADEPATDDVPAGDRGLHRSKKMLPEWQAFCNHVLPLWRIARWDVGIDEQAPHEQTECERLVVHFFLPYIDKDMQHIHKRTKNHTYSLADCLDRAKQKGARAERGVLLMLPIYKSAFTEVRCNLARSIGGWRGEKPGAGTPFRITCHPNGDLEPTCRAGTSGGRCLEEVKTPPEPPWSFAFVRDPFKRFVSGYSEVEYFITVGPPEVWTSKRPKGAPPPENIITNSVNNCEGCGFLSKPVNSIERAQEFIHDLLHLKLTPSPRFLWRHIYSQLGIMHSYNRVFDRRVEFLGSLEAMDSSWLQLLDLVQAPPRPFNTTCETHNYSNAKSGFKARETMTLLLKGNNTGDQHGAYVRALECAVLLPDKICLGYTGVLDPSDCVKYGYAESREDWEELIKELRALCPRAVSPHRDIF